MKKLTVLALMMVLALAACSRPALEPKPTPTAAPAAAAGAQASGGRIVAEGRVTPAKSAILSFAAGGIVSQVAVAPGAQVAAGQALAQLDTRQLELQLAQAEANLAGAQARLSQAMRGPTDQELAAAQQNVTSAQAAYDKLRAGPTASDAAAAKAGLEAAQRNYAKVAAGPSADQIGQLKAQLDNAKAAVDQAQAAYDRVGGAANPDIGRLPQALQLQQATNNYNAAVAAYNEGRSHPTTSELAAAQSQVQAARAALDRLAPDDAQIQAALAAVQNAKDQLAKLQSPSADDRAALQAAVNAAQAGRDLVAEQIKSAKLVAPFAGTVMTVDIDPGEYAAPGVPVLRLADTSAWQIETTDLTELNIAKVSEGTAATVTFDAIDGLSLNGHVSEIRPYGESKQGDIVYTVVVTPDRQDARLRWNMTAKVSIESR